MALIISIVIVAILFFYSPAAAVVVGLLAAVFFYKSTQRTKYMTDEEVNIAYNLSSIKDPEKRRRIKEEIEQNINRRMAADKKQGSDV